MLLIQATLYGWGCDSLRSWRCSTMDAKTIFTKLSPSTINFLACLPQQTSNWRIELRLQSSFSSLGAASILWITERKYQPYPNFLPLTFAHLLPVIPPQHVGYSFLDIETTWPGSPPLKQMFLLCFPLGLLVTTAFALESAPLEEDGLYPLND